MNFNCAGTLLYWNRKYAASAACALGSAIIKKPSEDSSPEGLVFLHKLY